MKNSKNKQLNKTESKKKYLYCFPKYWKLYLEPRIINAKSLSDFEYQNKSKRVHDWVVYLFKESKNGAIESTILILNEAWDMLDCVVGESIKDNKFRKEIKNWRDKLIAHRYEVKSGVGSKYILNFYKEIGSKNKIYAKLLENGDMLVKKIDSSFLNCENKCRHFSVPIVPILDKKDLDSKINFFM